MARARRDESNDEDAASNDSFPQGISSEARSVSKMEAVRRALEAIGEDASPGQIVEYVKANHGHDMTPKFASSYKSTILRTEVRRQVAQRFQDDSDDIGSGDGVSLRDIKALKDLAERYGADQLRELLDLLCSND